LVEDFTWLNNKKLIFGAGKRNLLPQLVRGSKVLLVTGSKSLEATGEFSRIIQGLESRGLQWRRTIIPGEPTPRLIDEAVEIHRNFSPSQIIAMGGGSVLDAGKAIAAMFCHDLGITNYLETVGTLQPRGETLPLIALPTTSGTGSEATKNAVISQPGPEGFKKSLRHDAYVPDIALLDPQLMLFCPRNTTLYSGLDAFTQLLEGLISTKANLFSNMTARKGLELFVNNFTGVLETPEDLHARGQIALAAYLSGVTLAHAGLGTVHGIAGTLGGLCNLPHGLICSRLIAPVFRYITEQTLNSEHLEELQWLGDLFAHSTFPVMEGGILGFKKALELLSALLPPLEVEFSEELIIKAANQSGDKNSPVSTTEKIRGKMISQAFSAFQI
jgi:alcohol dehydrogenase class IV